MPKRFWLCSVSFLMVISFAFCLYLAARNPSAAFYLLPTRFWEMAIGSIGALLPASFLLRTTMSWLRLPALAILLVIPIIPIGGHQPGVDAALICVGTFILLAPTKDNIAIFGLSKVGDLSYSLSNPLACSGVCAGRVAYRGSDRSDLRCACVLGCCELGALPFHRRTFPSRIPDLPKTIDVGAGASLAASWP